MKNCKILLIDDEPWIIDEFKNDFKDYSIKTFFDPNQVLEIIEEEKFDIFFLDIYMPKMNGINLCRAIRKSKLNRDSYVIAYTCEEDERRQLAIFQEDFDDFIEKPMRTEMVKTKINTLFSKRINKNTYFNQLVEVNHTYYLNDNKIKLTPTEFKILKLLSSDTLEYYNSNDIEELLKEKDKDTNISTARVHIKNIRNKLYDISPDIEYIQTVPQKGYVLTNLEVFSFRPDKIKSKLIINEDKPVIEAIQNNNSNYAQKISKLVSSNFLKGKKKTNNIKKEKQVYSFELTKDIFEKCEQLASQKGLNMSLLIDDFINRYYFLESISNAAKESKL